MYKQFYAQMEWTNLALFAFGVFAVTFTLVVLRTWLLRGPDEYQPLAELPLTKETIEVKP
jgi:hypothetical protein